MRVFSVPGSLHRTPVSSALSVECRDDFGLIERKRKVFLGEEIIPRKSHARNEQGLGPVSN